MAAISLVVPSRVYLPGYIAALETGWSPDNTQDIHREHLTSIRRDADAFLQDLVSVTGTIRHADGTVTERLPNKLFWIWDGEFCGLVSLRWQTGTDALPDYCPGHLGYTVVPWKRRHGYATAAVAQALDEARRAGLRRIFAAVDVHNVASRRVIEKSGGVRVGPNTPGPTGKVEPGAIGYWIEL
jgi:predicted acetyltransferase